MTRTAKSKYEAGVAYAEDMFARYQSDTIMLVQAVDGEARRGEVRQVTQSRVFGRVSKMRSGSKREAPHDTLLIQGASTSPGISTRDYMSATGCLSAQDGLWAAL